MGRGLVGSWSSWIGEATRIGDVLAEGVLGARPGEVLVGDSTTVNLYKLLVAAAAARPGRDVLVCTADDFPTDRYVVAGVAEARGMTVRELPGRHRPGARPGGPRRGAGRPRRRRRPLARRLPVGCAGRPGGRHPAGARRRRPRAVGPVARGRARCRSSSTAAGADLAVGCTYKYLNGGPGRAGVPLRPARPAGAAALADPGLVRPARPVRDGPGLRAGAGDRALRRRHPAGAGDGRRRGRRAAGRRGRRSTGWPPRAGR